MSLTPALALTAALAHESFRPWSLAAWPAAVLALGTLPRLPRRSRLDIAFDDRLRSWIRARFNRLALRPRLSLPPRLAVMPLLTLVALLSMLAWLTGLARLSLRARLTRLSLRTGLSRLSLLPLSWLSLLSLRASVLVPAAIVLAAAGALLSRGPALCFESRRVHHGGDLRRFQLQRVGALHDRWHRQRTVTRANEA